MTEPHLLTVDVGTSAARVSAVSPNGRVLDYAARPGRPQIEGDRAVLDAEALWVDLCRLLREVVGRAGQPLGLCVSAQLGTVLVDESLVPVCPVFLWQDRRAAGEAADLAAALAGRDGEIAGRPVTGELAAARVLWLARHQPAEWARTRWVLSLKDFILTRLVGAAVTDPTSASYTLLFDVRFGEWSSELAEAAEVPIERLPPVLAAHELCGVVATAAAESTGVSAGLPVAVGGPDGSVGVLGSGAGSAGLTVDVAGTTDVLLHTTTSPVADAGRRSILNAYLLPRALERRRTDRNDGRRRRLALPHARLRLARCGVLRPRVVGRPRLARSGRGRLPHGADRRAVPHVGDRDRRVGLRTPARPHAGSSAARRRGGRRLRGSGLDALAALGLDSDEVRISGGVTRRSELVQLRANAWGRPVIAVSTLEATTVGAAILAAVCSGVHSGVEDAIEAMVSVAPIVEPEPAVAAFDHAYARWQASRSAAA